MSKKRRSSRREAYKCTSSLENGGRKSPIKIEIRKNFYLLTVSFTFFDVFETVFYYFWLCHNKKWIFAAGHQRCHSERNEVKSNFSVRDPAYGDFAMQNFDYGLRPPLRMTRGRKSASCKRCGISAVFNPLL